MGFQEIIPSNDPEPVRVVFYGPLRHETQSIVDALVSQRINFVVERAGWGEEEKIRDPKTSMVVVGEDLADHLVLVDLRRTIGSKALLVIATPGRNTEGDLIMPSGSGIADVTAVLETATELRNTILDLLADLVRNHEQAEKLEMRIEWPGPGMRRYSDVPN